MSGGRLIVEAKGEEIGSYPLNNVDCITLFPGTNITPRLIQDLADKKKSVFWVDSFGNTYASVSFPGTESVVRRKAQYAVLDDNMFRTKIAGKIIEAKIANQRWFLEKYGRHGLSARKPIINGILDSVSNATDIDVIMGLEGYAARVYFECISEILPREWGFSKRTKHPPRDCFSALLSFLYMLLYNETVAAIRAADLDPDIGIMHSINEGHHALASDLMEEFRSVVCDSVAYDLVRSSKLSLRDFSTYDNGAVYLNKDASKAVVAAFLAKLNSNAGIKKKAGMGRSWKSVIGIQVNDLLKSLMYADPNLYSPVTLIDSEISGGAA